MKSLVLLVALVACAPRPPPAATAQNEYPGVLHPPAELHPDFSVHQHVEATAHGRSGSFDAVLEKRGGKLVVVGLGPASVRMFVLEQTASGITFEQSFGPTLPFPPRNIVMDVHRAFFKGLPPDAADGVRIGRVDDEEVREVWQGENLLERRFTRADRPEPITLTYSAGCTRTRCAPSRISIDNPWFSYKLVLENDSYEFFDAGATP